MSDDRLLRALGRLARERAVESAPPPTFSPEFTESTRRAAFSALGIKQPEPAAPPQETPERAGRAAADPALQRPRRAWLTWFFMSLTPAAAAGILFFTLRSPDVALPPYTLEASGGVNDVRSGEAGRNDGEPPLVLEAGSRVQLVLRPATPADTDVAIRLFWRMGQKLRPWSVPVERARGGSMRIEAPAVLPFGAGAGQLLAVIGAPRTVEDLDHGDAGKILQGAPGLQVLSVPVVWR